MACKGCASENLQELMGELTASFIDVTRVNVAPIYLSQNIVVCLDCGLTEVIVPPKQLELLKKGKAEFSS
jgi:hypothetical protein